mmetsp:Transcript_52931/g.133116  ORF Transcript_52931/g.133116 Transcript_52931/m.133116 type:complete len:220 (+) Transcript_52931:2281-2940(+)
MGRLHLQGTEKPANSLCGGAGADIGRPSHRRPSDVGSIPIPSRLRGLGSCTADVAWSVDRRRGAVRERAQRPGLLAVHRCIAVGACAGCRPYSSKNGTPWLTSSSTEPSAPATSWRTYTPSPFVTCTSTHSRDSPSARPHAEQPGLRPVSHGTLLVLRKKIRCVEVRTHSTCGRPMAMSFTSPIAPDGSGLRDVGPSYGAPSSLVGRGTSCHTCSGVRM